jgi:hypothetical protein
MTAQVVIRWVCLVILTGGVMHILRARLGRRKNS